VEILRPVYAGKAFTRVTIEASPVLASLRPNVFQPREAPAAGAVDPVPSARIPRPGPPRSWTSRATGGDVPDVSEASVVVSGGRG
jgi:electron transfer flavoprotein alpha subunit